MSKRTPEERLRFALELIVPLYYKGVSTVFLTYDGDSLAHIGFDVPEQMNHEELANSMYESSVYNCGVLVPTLVRWDELSESAQLYHCYSRSCYALDPHIRRYIREVPAEKRKTVFSIAE